MLNSSCPGLAKLLEKLENWTGPGKELKGENWAWLMERRRAVRRYLVMV